MPNLTRAMETSGLGCQLRLITWDWRKYVLAKWKPISLWRRHPLFLTLGNGGITALWIVLPKWAMHLGPRVSGECGPSTPLSTSMPASYMTKWSPLAVADFSMGTGTLEEEEPHPPFRPELVAVLLIFMMLTLGRVTYQLNLVVRCVVVLHPPPNFAGFLWWFFT